VTDPCQGALTAALALLERRVHLHNVFVRGGDLALRARKADNLDAKPPRLRVVPYRVINTLRPFGIYTKVR
jgi:hypothetical protein